MKLYLDGLQQLSLQIQGHLVEQKIVREDSNATVSIYIVERGNPHSFIRQTFGRIVLPLQTIILLVDHITLKIFKILGCLVKGVVYLDKKIIIQAVKNLISLVVEIPLIPLLGALGTILPKQAIKATEFIIKKHHRPFISGVSEFSKIMNVATGILAGIANFVSEFSEMMLALTSLQFKAVPSHFLSMGCSLLLPIMGICTSIIGGIVHFENYFDSANYEVHTHQWNC